MIYNHLQNILNYPLTSTLEGLKTLWLSNGCKFKCSYA